MSLLIDIVKIAQLKPIKKCSPELAKERVSICEGCPHMKDGSPRSCGKFLKGGLVKHEGKEIELCGCDIDDKSTYKDDGCPLGKW